jgi:hypothetical protein
MLLSMSQANAISCSATGPWALTAMLSLYQTPPTPTTFNNVWYGTGSTASKVKIYAFNTATPFNTFPTATVLICSGISSLASSQNVSCTQYPNAGSSSTFTMSFSGSLNTTTCALTGSVSPALGFSATIRGSYINGTYGTGVITTTTGQVGQFTLIHQ